METPFMSRFCIRPEASIPLDELLELDELLQGELLEDEELLDPAGFHAPPPQPDTLILFIIAAPFD
jgi:hypothetical protein